MGEDKYIHQKKYLKKLAQFPLKLKPELLEAFKQKCKENGTTATTVIMERIREYVEEE